MEQYRDNNNQVETIVSWLYSQISIPHRDHCRETTWLMIFQPNTRCEQVQFLCVASRLKASRKFFWMKNNYYVWVDLGAIYEDTYCGMQLLVLALDTCFWLTSPVMYYHEVPKRPGPCLTTAIWAIKESCAPIGWSSCDSVMSQS